MSDAHDGTVKEVAGGLMGKSQKINQGGRSMINDVLMHGVAPHAHACLIRQVATMTWID